MSNTFARIDRRLTWRKLIFTKNKQRRLKFGQMYCLLGRKFYMTLERKLLFYKAIIAPFGHTEYSWRVQPAITESKFCSDHQTLYTLDNSYWPVVCSQQCYTLRHHDNVTTNNNLSLTNNTYLKCRCKSNSFKQKWLRRSWDYIFNNDNNVNNNVTVILDCNRWEFSISQFAVSSLWCNT